MMVDGAGPEMLQHRRRHRGKQQGEPRRRIAGELACQPRYAGEVQQQQRGRPDSCGHALRQLRWRDHRAGANEGGERQIDQPRPVHRHPVGRAQPVLGEIEPALAGEQVAHLHQPHGVVGRLARPSAEACHQARRQVGCYRCSPNDQQQRAGLGAVLRLPVRNGC
jgi:hypothetical protein